MSRRSARVMVRWVLLLAGVACERSAPPPRNDTAVDFPSLPRPTDSVAAVAEALWDSAAGPVFLAVGPNSATASVIFPGLATDASVEAGSLDAKPFVGQSFDLFANGREVRAAAIGRLVPLDAPEECSGWPLVQLSGVNGDSSARTWVVGFARGRATAIPYDSITALSPADSSRLAIDIARLASSTPGDTVAELRGLPYQVRRAYRFSLATGGEGLFAEVWRTLNQEANPKQEHLLIIAERDSAASGRYELSYSERASGGEETLESSELLTIVRFAPARDLTMLLARYVGDGVVYALLERRATRRWRLRWSSPYVGC